MLLTDTGPYIEEILSKVEDEAVRQNIQEFLINRRRLDIGDLLGKGEKSLLQHFFVLNF